MLRCPSSDFVIQNSFIVPCVCRLHYVGKLIYSSDPTLAATETTNWTVVQLHASIIACVSYCSRSFTAAVSTNYGSVAINMEVFNTANLRSGYVQSEPKPHSREGSEPSVGNAANAVSVTAGNNTKGTGASNGSQGLVLVHEVQVQSKLG